MYDAKCPSEICEKKYIGGIGIRISEIVKKHNGREHKSSILKQSLRTEHEHVKSSSFPIISKNFNGNKRKKNVESLLIKQLHPTNNVHDESVPLKLFN